MSLQPNLFSPPVAQPHAKVRAEASYPDGAGWKEPTTSREAAASLDAGTLRSAVRACLASHGPMTADECARLIGMTVLAIRPRFSELRAKGDLVDTGERRLNVSGKRAAVWAYRQGPR